MKTVEIPIAHLLFRNRPTQSINARLKLSAFYAQPSSATVCNTTCKAASYLLTGDTPRLFAASLNFSYISCPLRTAKRCRSNICLTCNAYIGTCFCASDSEQCKNRDNSVDRLKQLLEKLPTILFTFVYRRNLMNQRAPAAKRRAFLRPIP